MTFPRLPLLLALGLGLFAPLYGQALPASDPTPAAESAESLYRQALASYLDGDYDKAIVATAQSLEKDPNFEKSKNLLALLSAEKDNEGRSVIWLAGKQTPPPPPSVPAPGAPALSAPDMARLESEINSVRAQENNNRRFQVAQANQMAGQLDVIHDMVSINASGQYQELRSSQVELDRKVQSLGRQRWGSLFWVVLLSLSSLGVSLYTLWGLRLKRRA
jgi:hypothetical protein